MLLEYGADKTKLSTLQEYPIDCLPHSDSLDSKKILNLLFIKDRYVYDDADYSKYNTSNSNADEKYKNKSVSDSDIQKGDK